MDDVRELLDGEVERRPNGFDCWTASKMLFVPYSTTTDAAAALLLCRERGIVKQKLASMDRGAADVLYGITLAAALLEN
jgi:hypothetical protein